MHAGTSGAVARAKGEALTAWSALAAVAGREVELVDPAQAVMGMLHMSWLRVHLLAGLLEDQVGAEGASQPAGTGRTDDGEGVVGDAAAGEGAAGEGGTSGLVGHTYGAVKDVGIYASGEAARALVQLEAAERDRCVRFAKTAHDMGIADREIRLVEAQTQLVAVAFGRALDAVGLSVEQREEAARVLVAELRVQAMAEEVTA